MISPLSACEEGPAIASGQSWESEHVLTDIDARLDAHCGRGVGVLRLPQPVTTPAGCV